MFSGVLLWASLVAQMVKTLPAVREIWVQSLGWKDPLEKEMATHSSILACRIHGQRSLVDNSPQGHKESDTIEGLTHTHMYISILNIVPSGSSFQLEVICLFKQILTFKVMK